MKMSYETPQFRKWPISIDEELLEVEDLTVVGHVDDLGGIVFADAALDACDVRGRVVEAAVRLPDDGDGLQHHPDRNVSD